MLCLLLSTMLWVAHQQQGIVFPYRLSQEPKLTDATVMLIGIDQYQGPAACFNPNALAWPVADIEGFEKVFRGCQVRRLRNTDAKLEAVRKAFKQLIAESQSRFMPLVFVIWAGHGFICNERYHVQAHDALMPVEELKDLVDQIQTGMCIFALDVCHAGGFANTLSQSWQKQEGRSSIYILSSYPEESAKDEGFFQALLEGLAGLAIENLDLNTSCEVHLREAFDYAGNQLSGQVPIWLGPTLHLPFPVDKRLDQLDVRFVSSEPVAVDWPSRHVVSRKWTLKVSAPAILLERRIRIEKLFFVYKAARRDPVQVPMRRENMIYQVDLAATALPLGALQYAFRLEYAGGRTITSRWHPLTVVPEP